MSTELVLTTFQVEAVINAWLQETLETKSGSAKTQLAYQNTLMSYRAALVAESLDLDSMDTARLVEIAQRWAGQRATNAKAWNTGKPVADSTYNQRLAVVSSFYSRGRTRILAKIAHRVHVFEKCYEKGYTEDGKGYLKGVACISLHGSLSLSGKSKRLGKRFYTLVSGFRKDPSPTSRGKRSRR